VAVFRDVTERRQAEQALRESEERYRSVMSAMQDGVALLDTEGAIRACNASAERILGLSADQMMGRTPRDPRWQAIQEDGTPLPDEISPAHAVGKAEFTVREYCRLGRLKAEKRQSGRGAYPQWVLSRAELERYRRNGLLPGK
jgi:PAS domain-containing protein